MKQKISLLFLALAMFVATTPSRAQAETTPTVIISEIAWAGSSTSTADEWMELTNMTDQPIDASGWLLDGATSATLTLPPSSIIAPHATYVIANYDNTNKNSALATHAQFVTTAISLSNDKLKITLAKKDGTLVDSVGDGGNPLAGGSQSTGGTILGRVRSMERRGSLLNGALKDSWSDADTTLGFKDGILDEGTPGIVNDFLQKEIDTISAPAPMIVSPVIETPVVETEPVCEDITTTNTTPPSDEQPAISSANETIPSETNTPPVEEQPQTATTIATASIISALPGSLLVNELYPHPATDESEWVEVLNASSSTIVTNGWSLTDASDAVTPFPNGKIPPGSLLVIENPKGKLNNDGDTIIIKDPTGAVIDAVMYNTDLGLVPAVGESLMRTGTHALAITTTPTKNSDNVATQRPTINPVPNTNQTTQNSNADISIIATNTAPAVLPNPNPPTPQTDTSSLLHSPPKADPPPAKITSSLPLIHLSEFYPNTGGNDATDEFIEIKNDGNETVSLDGWSITDGSGTRFTFAKTDMIGPHAFLARMRPQSKITLNNSGDTITLFAPDQSPADTQTYDQAKANLAFANINGVWGWTGIPTPNESNRMETNNEPIGERDAIGTTTIATTAPSATTVRTVSARVLTIADAKLETDGTRVTVSGFVSVLPNVFNSQTMYVQDETGGIQLFKSDCKFPPLTLGQEVTATGTLSHANGEIRIKISKSSSMHASSTVVPVIASSDSTNDGSSSIGSLITIAGMVTSRSGNQAFVDADGKKWTIDLPKESTNTQSFAKGSQIQVSGILAQSKSGLRLKPRSDQDIVETKPIAMETPSVVPLESQNQSMAILLMILASVAFVALKLRPKIYSLIKPYGRKQTLASRS